MAYLSLYTVCVILFVLHTLEARSLNIDRSLCLETIIKFMHGQQKCLFNYMHADGLLKDDNVTCQTKCHVTTHNIYNFYYMLGEVELRFGDEINKYKPCIPVLPNTLVLNMYIACPAWNEVKVPIGGYCKQDEQCHGSENSGVCKLGKCVCRVGYVLFNLECHKGNLALNQSCSFSDQCAGSPYASCLREKCSCVDGYTAENATSCVQSQKSILPKFQHQEANIGTTLGALFGGLLLGVILTTVAVMIMYRRSKKHVNKREEFNVTFADNDTYSSAKVVDPKAFQNIQTKNKKLEVSPYPGSEETSVYNNVCGKPKNGQTQDDVYNHLHEQVKRDDVDYYDHACAASANIGDMGDYSHLRHTTS